jgi:hypothetical protein
MFQDRRSHSERRNRRRSAGSGFMECRRGTERRNILRQYHPQPWWLQTNYAEELDPPTLANSLIKRQ